MNRPTITPLLEAYSGALTRLEIHTPDHKLNDPRVRGGLYGLIVATQIIHRAINTRPQLERHAYPGQPSKRTQPTTADQVIGLADQLGITLEPWQQRAIRQLYPAGTQPCSCWYTYLCCGVLASTPDQASHLRKYYGTHSATGFVLNPNCPHHGTQSSAHNTINTPTPGA